MRLTLLLASATLFFGAPTAHAGVYLDIRDAVEEQMQKMTTELAVQEYVKAAVKPFGVDLTDNNIDEALAGEISSTDLCGALFEGFTYCPFAEEQIRYEINRVSKYRQLAYEMQLSISGYESLANGYTKPFSLQLAGIVNLWQSGVDELLNSHGAGRIRTRTMDDPDDLTGPLNTLRGKLNGLVQNGVGRYDDEKIDKKKLASAVWRYRHGYKKVKNSGPCNDGEGDGSPLELLTVRWCEVEDALEDIWNELPTDPNDYFPPLAEDEQVIFPHEVFDDLGIIVWMRNDDVGLVWSDLPEPVVPSLLTLTGGIINHGKYPEIRDGQKLYDFIEGGPDENPVPTAPIERSICSHPMGKRGYLCRPYLSAECPTDPDPGSANEVQLTDCIKQNTRHPIEVTQSGPDMCQIGGWRLPVEGANFSDDDWSAGDEISEQCENCYIELGCAGAGSNCTWGLSQPKASDGRIRVCASGDAIPARYILMKEVSHAQTMCHREAGLQHSSAEECCSAYWYPSMVACSAMMADGLLSDTDFTAEECASILTDKGCEANFGANACTEVPLDNDRVDELKDAANQVGQSCGDAVADKDPRIVALMESSPMLCDPNCKVQYENTIGNNMCYISQCIEQATEFHRIIPGRMPLNAQDQAFPWDACTEDDPQLANLLPMPDPELTIIPEYRGQQLLNEFEQYFCSQVGRPEAILPSYCRLTEDFSIGLPLETHAGTLEKQQLQRRAEERMNAQIGSTMSNVTARIAASDRERYMGQAMFQLQNLLDILTAILTEIGEVNFPELMCPRYHIEGCEVFEPATTTP